MILGDVIDIVLHEEAVVSHVRVETGFDASEERSGTDTIKLFCCNIWFF